MIQSHEVEALYTIICTKVTDMKTALVRHISTTQGHTCKTSLSPHLCLI